MMKGVKEVLSIERNARKVLQDAEKEAEKIRREAEKESKGIIADAKKKARSIIEGYRERITNARIDEKRDIEKESEDLEKEWKNRYELIKDKLLNKLIKELLKD